MDAVHGGARKGRALTNARARVRPTLGSQARASTPSRPRSGTTVVGPRRGSSQAAARCVASPGGIQAHHTASSKTAVASPLRGVASTLEKTCLGFGGHGLFLEHEVTEQGVEQLIDDQRPTQPPQVGLRAGRTREDLMPMLEQNQDRAALMAQLDAARHRHHLEGRAQAPRPTQQAVQGHARRRGQSLRPT